MGRDLVETTKPLQKNTHQYTCMFTPLSPLVEVKSIYTYFVHDQSGAREKKKKLYICGKMALNRGAERRRRISVYGLWSGCSAE